MAQMKAFNNKETALIWGIKSTLGESFEKAKQAGGPGITRNSDITIHLWRKIQNLVKVSCYDTTLPI